jgi:hypothetical protein
MCVRPGHEITDQLGAGPSQRTSREHPITSAEVVAVEVQLLEVLLLGAEVAQESQ